MTGIAIAILITNFGCISHSFYYQKYPIIQKPNRPFVEVEYDVEDVKSLMKYAKQLEKSIDLYNSYAVQQNKKLEEKLSNKKR